MKNKRHQRKRIHTPTSHNELRGVLGLEDEDEEFDGDNTTLFDDNTPRDPEEDKESSARTQWGRHAANYYEDKLDVEEIEDEDEDDLAMMEEEAILLRQSNLARLEAADFGTDQVARAALTRASKTEDNQTADDDDDVQFKDGFQQELEAILSSLDSASHLNNKQQRQESRKQLLKRSPPSEQRRVVEEAHPELGPLLEDMSQRLTEATDSVQPLLVTVRNNEDAATFEGLTFLETKNQLLLSYISYLCFYILLKCNGAPIANHPLVERLVELRLLLEKLRPIESSLRYKIDKLVDLANSKQDTSNETQQQQRRRMSVEATVSGPRPDLLLRGKGDDDDDDLLRGDDLAEGGTAAYSPPKLVAVEYTGEQMTEMQKARKRLENEKRKLKRSQLVRHLRAELVDAPPEIGTGGVDLDDGPDDSTFALLEREGRKEREEEENLMRLPAYSKDRKALEKLRNRKRPFGGGATLEDVITFADEAIDTDSVDPTLSGRSSTRASLGKYLNAARQALQSSRKNQVSKSGDTSVRFRQTTPPSQNQSKVEKVVVDSGDDESGEEIIDDINPQRQLTEDERRRLPSLVHDETVSGRRAISRTIQKNQGLSRQRKKFEGNPRVHNRVKFERKLKRHKAMHPKERKQPAHGGYSGEATGVRSNVTRSTRFA